MFRLPGVGSEIDGTEGPQLARLRRLAWWLDAGIPIPGTDFRFGLDPIIGLIPGLGDGVGAVLSGGILLEAAHRGASRATLLRMALNIAIDSLVGAVPVLGDVFDFVWKSNLKNVALLERALQDPPAGAKADGIFLTLLLVALLVICLGLAVGSALAVSWLLR
jgi:uncharacterized protein DUF4112